MSDPRKYNYKLLDNRLNRAKLNKLFRKAFIF
jgi:hypothetical protein